MRQLIAISALLMLFSAGGCAPTNVVETWQIYDPVNIVQPVYPKSGQGHFECG